MLAPALFGLLHHLCVKIQQYLAINLFTSSIYFWHACNELEIFLNMHADPHYMLMNGSNLSIELIRWYCMDNYIDICNLICDHCNSYMWSNVLIPTIQTAWICNFNCSYKWLRTVLECKLDGCQFPDNTLNFESSPTRELAIPLSKTHEKIWCFLLEIPLVIIDS